MAAARYHMLLRLCLLLLLPLPVVLAVQVTASSAAVYIVKLKPQADIEAAANLARSAGGTVIHEYHNVLHGYAADLSDSELATVEADPQTLMAKPDSELKIAARPLPPPPDQILPFGVDRIDAETLSPLAMPNIAVLDSGIFPSHPDLNIAGGFNCVGGGSSFDDKFGHGTNVAGIIGAKEDDFGAVGVAPGYPLWAVRVLRPNGRGMISALICGIEFVTGTRTGLNPPNPISVANMSLGAPGFDDGNCGLDNDDFLHQAICESVEEGVTYVVSAGNQQSNFQGIRPASYREVLTATAMTDYDGKPGGEGTKCDVFPNLEDLDDSAASFSNFATSASVDGNHTVAAPGVCIFTTAAPIKGSVDLYTTVAEGTSLAAPHVAGVVARCIANNACPPGTPAATISTIISDAKDHNDFTNPGYGFIGDPNNSSIGGPYFGYLLNASLYSDPVIPLLSR